MLANEKRKLKLDELCTAGLRLDYTRGCGSVLNRFDRRLVRHAFVDALCYFVDRF